MNELKDTDTGSYFVTTEHSVYMVDLDQRWLVRTPWVIDASTLRQDGSKVKLVAVKQCKVGHHAIFALDGLADSGPTSRLTTLVLSIARAA